jgi:hypothetical protein
MSQVRQAELEQSNMELSIGITERQREITRLKILQEQVTYTPQHCAHAHTLSYHSHSSHKPHTPLIISYCASELISHSAIITSRSLSLPHSLLSLIAFQEGREDVHASVREVRYSFPSCVCYTVTVLCISVFTARLLY